MKIQAQLLVLSLLSLLLATGCDSSENIANSIAGTYTLTHHNGEEVPTENADDPDGISVAMSSPTLEEDDSFEGTMVIDGNVINGTGRYSLNGDSLHFFLGKIENYESISYLGELESRGEIVGEVSGDQLRVFYLDPGYSGRGPLDFVHRFTFEKE